MFDKSETAPNNVLLPCFQGPGREFDNFTFAPSQRQKICSVCSEAMSRGAHLTSGNVPFYFYSVPIAILWTNDTIYIRAGEYGTKFFLLPRGQGRCLNCLIFHPVMFL